VRWGRRISLGILVLLVLVVVWAVASWFSFSGGVSDANKRLDQNAKLALTSQGGLVLSHSTTILMLGTDNARVGGREGDMHSDSIMLLRTDPPVIATRSLESLKSPVVTGTVTRSPARTT